MERDSTRAKHPNPVFSNRAWISSLAKRAEKIHVIAIILLHVIVIIFSALSEKGARASVPNVLFHLTKFSRGNLCFARVEKKNSFAISVNPHGIFRFVPELKLCGSIKDPYSHPREGQGNS